MKLLQMGAAGLLLLGAGSVLGLLFALERPALARRAPAERWQAFWQQAWTQWRQRFQRLDGPQDRPSGFWILLIASQGWVIRHLEFERQGLMPLLVLAFFMAGALHHLYSSGLHWRSRLAPGAAQRRGLALRIVASSLWVHGGVLALLALPFVLLLVVMKGAIGSLSIFAVLLPMWGVAVVAACWLQANDWTPHQRVLRVAGAWALFAAPMLLVQGLLGWAQGPAVLLGSLVAVAVLLPLAQRAWQSADLARFTPAAEREASS